MSSEALHAPRDRLKAETLTRHHAIISLMEELEASDWYQQRADDCEDDALREILLHNMREEIEHACMVLEWLRRNDAEWEKNLRTYLFTDAPITEVEKAAEAEHLDDANADAGTPRRRDGFTVGPLKDK